MTSVRREDLIVLLGREALYPTPMDDPGSLGAQVDDLLLDLLQDPSLAAESAHGGGWVPIHAATLLGRRQVLAAVTPLLNILRTGDRDDAAYSAAVQALSAMGPDVLAPVLDQWRTQDPRDSAPATPFSDHAYIAAHCGGQDDRVLPRLLHGLSDPKQTEYYANLLAAYGDRRALPHLSACFDTMAAAEGAPATATLRGLRELREAVELLDGELRVDQALRMAGLEGEAARASEAATATGVGPRQRQRGKHGRNQPCWCGSGRKYKRCHAGSDARSLYDSPATP